MWVILGPWLLPAYAAPVQDVETAQEAESKSLDVSYIPTPQHVVDLMLHMGRVKKDDVLYDLGCGDGRIVVTAAKRFGCRALGVDIDPARVSDSLQNVADASVEDLVAIEQQDIFEVDLSKADVVTMYLTPDLIVGLLPQLEKMKPGSRIISHKWDMRGVEPDAVVSVFDRDYGESNDIYLWEVPLKKLPVVDDLPTNKAPQKKSHFLDDAWAYVSQHGYQRGLLFLVIASLGLAAFLGAAQTRSQVDASKRHGE